MCLHNRLLHYFCPLVGHNSQCARVAEQPRRNAMTSEYVLALRKPLSKKRKSGAVCVKQRSVWFAVHRVSLPSVKSRAVA